MRSTKLSKSFSPVLWVNDFSLAMELIGQFPGSIVGILYKGIKPNEWLFANSLDIEMYVEAYKTRAVEHDQ